MTDTIFTQEMADAGEMPPVGSDVVLRYMHDSKTVLHVGEVLYASKSHCILRAVLGGERCYHIGDYAYEAVQTERENAIESIIDVLINYEADVTELVKNRSRFKGSAAAIYDAGYRKVK